MVKESWDPLPMSLSLAQIYAHASLSTGFPEDPPKRPSRRRMQRRSTMLGRAMEAEGELPVATARGTLCLGHWVAHPHWCRSWTARPAPGTPGNCVNISERRMAILIPLKMT